jgi:hypothetical protein
MLRARVIGYVEGRNYPRLVDFGGRKMSRLGKDKGTPSDWNADWKQKPCGHRKPYPQKRSRRHPTP